MTETVEYNKSNISKGFSIITCTYNGEDRLGKTLKYLSQLLLPEDYSVELILVDNASTDGTIEFADDLWKKLGSPFPLIVYEEKRTGKGYAVETGYDAAKYSYLLIVDDDNWLDPNYLIHAADLFSQHSDVAILQGKSEGVFEKEPPAWVHNFLPFYIIGSPIRRTGYFPQNNCWVWGAGMIIKNEHWKYLRSIGFSFLTSKLPGKAAGEDNELAIALLMMGKKIYYSDLLQYKHFMPKERITWEKLKQNFTTFGYVSYYFFLYSLFMDAYQKKYEITDEIITNKFYKHWQKKMPVYPFLRHLAHHIISDKSILQLRFIHHWSMLQFFLKLRKNALHDIKHISQWMPPVFEKYGSHFILPL